MNIEIKIVGLSIFLSFTVVGVITLIMMGNSPNRSVYWIETNEIIRVSEILMGCFGIAICLKWIMEIGQEVENENENNY